MWTFRAGLVLLGLLSVLNTRGMSIPQQVHLDNDVQLWSATQALQQATVISNGAQCTEWTGTRFRCGRADWEWVGRHIGTITTNEFPDTRPCVWLHPRGTGDNGLTFDNVPVGAHISGYVGLLDSAKNGRAVTVDIRLDDTRQKQLLLNDRRRGWHELHLDTQATTGSDQTVSINIRTASPDWRHICIQLFVDPNTASQGSEPTAL